MDYKIASLLFMSMVFLTGCTKDDSKDNAPPIDAVGNLSLTWDDDPINCNINGYDIVKFKVSYNGTLPYELGVWQVTENEQHPFNQSTLGTFYLATKITENTYECKIKTTNGYPILYPEGKIHYWATGRFIGRPDIPEVYSVSKQECNAAPQVYISGKIKMIDSTTFELSGNVYPWNASPLIPPYQLTNRGVIYSSIVSDPTTSDGSNSTIINNLGPDDSFKLSLSGLELNTTYYARIYCVNGNSETFYSPTTSFKTPTKVKKPVIYTDAVTGVTNNSFICGGWITDEGESPVTQRGVVYGTSPNPTVANGKTIDGAGSGMYVSNVTGLTPGTQYFVRAYATNNEGTFYGDEKFETTTN